MKLRQWIVAPILLLSLNVFAEDIITGGEGPTATLQSGQPFTVASWNIHKEHGAAFLKEFNSLFAQSDLFCLQEVELDSNTVDQWNAFENVNWFMASAWETGSGPTGTGLLAKVQTQDVTAVVSDKGQPISSTPKSSTVAYLPVSGSDQKILLITTHALNFTGLGPFKNQLLELAQIIESHHGPVLWTGDFNTWNGGRHEYLWELTAGLGLAHVALDGDEAGEGLDHVFQRGLTVLSATKLQNFNESDHKPLLLRMVYP